MHAGKSAIGGLAGSIGKPYERQRHDLRLDQPAPVKADQQLDRGLRSIEFFSKIKPESVSS
jgi:hypothetical protein